MRSTMKRWNVAMIGLGLVFVIVGCKKDLSATCMEAADKSCTKFEKGSDLRDLCYDGFEHYSDEECQESLKLVDKLEGLPPLESVKPPTKAP